MKKEMSKEIELAFLIADLSGYTALTEAHGNMSAAEAVTRYVEIVHEVLHPSARLVERVGDEVLIAADEAACLVQTAINLRDTIELEPLFPTMHAGIHAGSVLEMDGGYFGKALNLGSRVAAHARGNQILCTEQVVTMASDLKDVEYRALGPTRFKNITDPVEIFEVIARRQKVESNLIDPVCRMQVRHDTAPARLPFGGKTYYFCSFDCAKKFVNKPEIYVGA
jgi:class 3 adenylate cyclase/YHS domain-containing protein